MKYIFLIVSSALFFTSCHNCSSSKDTMCYEGGYTHGLADRGKGRPFDSGHAWMIKKSVDTIFSNISDPTSEENRPCFEAGYSDGYYRKDARY